MTVIYVDTLFFLNAIIDYLLLLASARLAGEPLHRLRYGLGASIGGLYAVGLFVPGFSFLRRPIYKFLSALLMLMIAYGSSRRLVRQALIFLSLTCAFGGVVVAIGLLGGQGLSLGYGIFYSVMDQKIVLLSAALCYVVITMAFQRLGKHSAATELFPVRFSLFGQTVELTALLDTGNTLSDPISGRGVIVAEASALYELFPPGHQPTPELLADPVGALARLGTGRWQGRFRLLPYRAVGVACGLLLAVKMDWIEVHGTRQGGQLVALSPTPLSDGGGYRAMMGRDGGT